MARSLRSIFGGRTISGLMVIVAATALAASITRGLLLTPKPPVKPRKMKKVVTLYWVEGPKTKMVIEYVPDPDYPP